MFLALGFKSVVQHAQRSLLVGGAIAVVTFIVMVLSGITHEAREHVRRISTSLVAGELDVAGIYKPSVGVAHPYVAEVEPVLALLKTVVPEATALVPRQRTFGLLASRNASLSNLLFSGIDPAQEPGLAAELRISQGSLKALERPGTVLLFGVQAKKLGVGVGDSVVLSGATVRGAHNAIDLEVAAIADNTGGFLQDLVFVPRDTLHEFMQLPKGAASLVQVHVGPEHDVAELQARVRKALADQQVRVFSQDLEDWPKKRAWAETQLWSGQMLDVLRWDEQIGPQAFFLTLLQVVIGFTGVVMLLVASVGLMNTLWVSIRERTQEIGTLRAIGMQRGGVVRLFLAESWVLAVLGSLAGVALALGAGAVVNASSLGVPSTIQVFFGLGSELKMSWATASVVTMALLIQLATTLVSAAPAYLASRISPNVSMNAR